MSNDHTRHEDFATWDAAYVLGALTPPDRRAFEAHLDTCERCRDSVSDLAPLPGLLTRARPLVDEPADAGDTAVGAPPENLVDLVQAREERRRRTARRRVTWVAVGAAAVLALGTAVPVAILNDGPEPAAVVAMDQVGETSMTATLALEDVAWGTAISMTCDYPADASWSGPGGAYAYSLIVTDASGETSQVATWTAVPGKTVEVAGSTAVPLEDIASIQVVSSTGDVLLESRPT